MSKNPEWLPKIVPVLKFALPKLEQTGKQSVYWLCGGYICNYTNDFLWATDLVRLAALGFSKEDKLVKLQIMTFALQAYVSLSHEKEILRIILDYILTMAQYDANIDIRDRSRFFRKLLEIEGFDLVKCLHSGTSNLFSKSIAENELYDFGTLSCLRKVHLKGYNPLPPFPSSNLSISRKSPVSINF